MNSVALPFDDQPEVEQPDRLTFMLFLAAAAHAMVILGVSFSPVLEEMRTPPALEVILVDPNTDAEKPDKANYLSSSAQLGGGDTDELARPSSPFSSNQDFDTDGIAPTPMQAQAPDQPQQQSEEILTTVFSDREELTEQPDTETNPEIDRKNPLLVEQNQDIARLEAEVDMRVEEYAKRPKTMNVTASTHKSAAADYMYSWVEKIEGVGNLNYPDVARRENLTGAVLMVVGVYKDGSIESIRIKRSSGEKVLDDAAVRIVRLAAPFQQMSPELARQTDILYIVRTWDFRSNNSLDSY